MAIRTTSAVPRTIRALGVLGGVLLLAFPIADAAAATATQKPPMSAASIIAELGDGMPSSFDVRIDDPCSGAWDAQFSDGTLAMKLVVFRYRGVLVMHRGGPRYSPSNFVAKRLDPNSVGISGVLGSSLELRCVGSRAVLTAKSAGIAPVVLNARPSAPDDAPRSPAQAQPSQPADATAKLSPALAAAGGSVRERYGDIEYVDASGATRELTHGGGYGEPVLSPDERMVAFVHIDRKPAEEGDTARTSLWIADQVTGAVRKLLASKADDEPKRNLASFGNPRFSLDGGYLYIDADAWATSSAVHQVNVATGEEKFMVDGWVTGIIRTGPYRGYLIVGQHRYRKGLQGGSYNPLSVIRPDGRAVLVIPGSDGDNNGRDYQAEWLKKNGWQAW